MAFWRPRLRSSGSGAESKFKFKSNRAERKAKTKQTRLARPETETKAKQRAQPRPRPRPRPRRARAPPKRPASEQQAASNTQANQPARSKGESLKTRAILEPNRSRTGAQRPANLLHSGPALSGSLMALGGQFIELLFASRQKSRLLFDRLSARSPVMYCARWPLIGRRRSWPRRRHIAPSRLVVASAGRRQTGCAEIICMIIGRRLRHSN